MPWLIRIPFLCQCSMLERFNIYPNYRKHSWYYVILGERGQGATGEGGDAAEGATDRVGKGGGQTSDILHCQSTWVLWGALWGPGDN